jgi:hypothetical protein
VEDAGLSDNVLEYPTAVKKPHPESRQAYV